MARDNLGSNTIDDFILDDDDHIEADENEDIFVRPEAAQSSRPTNDIPSSNSNSVPSAGGFMNFASFANPFNNVPNPPGIEVSERQFSGGNTLDESVLVTLHRDLSKIGEKLLQILWPLKLRQRLVLVQRIGARFASDGTGSLDSSQLEAGDDTEEYSKEAIKKILDWDLWGPLVIVLGFSLIITYLQTRSVETSLKSSEIFSAAFTLLWATLTALSVNIQLFAPVSDANSDTSHTGTIALSLFQCISILGYGLFPIVIGGLISIFLTWKWIRIIVEFIAVVWAVYSIYLILRIVNNSGSNKGKGDDRLLLTVYPIALVYGIFAWLTVIS
ncbi:unnamed protein product [Kuraishia capsulata CBS 1993]|uniref:Protein YIP n=1 Tax=Kuraishia capsulata CBS 1993 TaxID=1382522 RepID=W6MMM5_9ASCO|nr:uncharacterized protein KUCA_T00002173001 [Kuraishia capsulata CBS 1993]CDK26202.1 unnamed protein product [Kuraishia capsulata CBS 1993]